MPSLRSQVIRLAHQNPTLRPHLLPLLKTAKGFDPAHYGLDGLLRGEPTTLFHGTVAAFKVFDLAYSRDELVDQFYGKGIFLTPSKRVAAQYANANRNMGLPKSVISDLKRANPNAGAFLQALYEMGVGSMGGVRPGPWVLERHPGTRTRDFRLLGVRGVPGGGRQHPHGHLRTHHRSQEGDPGTRPTGRAHGGVLPFDGIPRLVV